MPTGGRCFYLCGGSDGSDTCEQYCVGAAAAGWEGLEERVPVGIVGAAAVGHDRFLYVIGGYSTADGYLSSLFRYDTVDRDGWQVNEPLHN